MEQLLSPASPINHQTINAKKTQQLPPPDHVCEKKEKTIVLKMATNDKVQAWVHGCTGVSERLGFTGVS